MLGGALPVDVGACGYLSSSEEGSGHPPFSASHAVPPLLLALQAGIPHLIQPIKVESPTEAMPSKWHD